MPHTCCARACASPPPTRRRCRRCVAQATDFGLSVFFKPGQEFADIVGSAYYVAPEVGERRPRVQERRAPRARRSTRGTQTASSSPAALVTPPPP